MLITFYVRLEDKLLTTATIWLLAVFLGGELGLLWVLFGRRTPGANSAGGLFFEFDYEAPFRRTGA